MYDHTSNIFIKISFARVIYTLLVHVPSIFLPKLIFKKFYNQITFFILMEEIICLKLFYQSKVRSIFLLVLFFHNRILLIYVSCSLIMMRFEFGYSYRYFITEKHSNEVVTFFLRRIAKPYNVYLYLYVIGQLSQSQHNIY